MRTLVVALVSALALGCGTDSSGEGAATDEMGENGEPMPTAQGPQSLEQRLEDPQVAQIYRSIMDSIAPDDGWARTRYIQFDWMIDRGDSPPVRRSHRWDVHEGDYRVEAPVGENQMVALFDVDAPTEGERIWLDGTPVEDEARSDSLATRAHAMFINDSYWLLFPFKWADPGVSTRYIPSREVWGEEYEAVELTFDDVGLTPQNRYIALIDPETRMMELWQHFSEASDTVPQFTNRWTDWQDYGPILLSAGRENQDGESTIYFENLAAATEIPDGAFAPPGE